RGHAHRVDLAVAVPVRAVVARGEENAVIGVIEDELVQLLALRVVSPRVAANRSARSSGSPDSTKRPPNFFANSGFFQSISCSTAGKTSRALNASPRIGPVRPD